MALGWRDAAVGGSGLLVLASGFLPWWAVRVRVGDATETYAGSAWRMSSRWSAAVLVTVAAAAVWLIWRLVRAQVPRAAWLLVLAAVALSVFLVVDQRSDVRPWSRSGMYTVTIAELGVERDRDPARDIAAGWMKRNDLVSYRSDGLNVDMSWGFWAGLGAIVLVGMSLVVAGTERSRAG
jgi:hypothetical protein